MAKHCGPHAGPWYKDDDNRIYATPCDEYCDGRIVETDSGFYPPGTIDATRIVMAMNFAGEQVKIEARAERYRKALEACEATLTSIQYSATVEYELSEVTGDSYNKCPACDANAAHWSNKGAEPHGSDCAIAKCLNIARRALEEK